MSMRNQLLGNRYRILDLIGEGGMAYVYLAMDEKLGRKVAIKVLHEHMERNADIRQRFQLEAQAVSSIEHPNIVKVYDFSGDQVGRLWIVTEVINGKNLAQYVQQTGDGWLHPVIAACLVGEICKALDKAHAHGIVHRDVKPENIMVTYEGRVKLMDFGIAKDLGKSGMTVTGTFMGSPSYMSPEQIRGRDIDLRSDLYSLSVLFYEIISGRLPFTGQTTHDVVLKIMEGNFTHPRFLVAGLPLPINDLIVRGMAKNPNERPATARIYGDEVARILYGLGFDESHVELERYFKDRASYHQRLAATKTMGGPAFASPQPTMALRPSAATGAFRRQPTAAFTATNYGQQPQPYQASRMPPPPPSALPRASVYQPAPRPATAYLPPKRPVPPVAMRAQAPRARGPSRSPQSVNANGWLGYLLGSLLVGLTCAISVWGFWGLQSRLSSHTRRKPNAETEWRESVRESVKSAKRAVKARREGATHAAAKIAALAPAVVQAPGPTATPAPVPAPNAAAPVPPAPASSPAAVHPGRAKAAPKRSDAKDGGKAPAKKKDREKRSEGRDDASRLDLASLVNASQSAAPAHAAAAADKDAGSDVEANTAVEKDKPAPKPAKVDKPEREKAEKAEKADERPDKAPEKKDLSSGKAPEKKDVSGGKGRIVVSSQPAAEVFIDGRRYGTTIDNTSDSGWLSLASGHHNLELRRKDYTTFRRAFDLAADEQKTFPRVALEAGGQRSGGNGRSSPETLLTLRINAGPAQASVRNLDTNATQVFTMKASVKTLQLPPGRYHVRIEHGSEVKERDLILSGAESQLTFSADFRLDE